MLLAFCTPPLELFERRELSMNGPVCLQVAADLCIGW